MHLLKFKKIQNHIAPSSVLLIVNIARSSSTSRFKNPAHSYYEYINYEVKICFTGGYASPISGSCRIEDGGMLIHMRTIPLVK